MYAGVGVGVEFDLYSFVNSTPNAFVSVFAAAGVIVPVLNVLAVVISEAVVSPSSLYVTFTRSYPVIAVLLSTT